MRQWTGGVSSNPMQIIEANDESNANMQMETHFQLNTDKDWANLNLWGSAMIPLETEASNFFAAQHFPVMEQLGVQGNEQDGRGMVMSTQSSNKGKSKILGVGRGRGKKAEGVEKGKAKIISTGHRAAKRGKGIVIEDQTVMKKAKVTDRGTEDRLIFGELESLEISIVDENLKQSMAKAGQGNLVITEAVDQEAEAGDSQPRLEP